MLRVEEESEQEKTLYLVKREVLEMADKFDLMHGIITRQQGMLDALVQGLARIQSAQCRGCRPTSIAEASSEEGDCFQRGGASPSRAPDPGKQGDAQDFSQLAAQAQAEPEAVRISLRKSPFYQRGGTTRTALVKKIKSDININILKQMNESEI